MTSSHRFTISLWVVLVLLALTWPARHWITFRIPKVYRTVTVTNYVVLTLERVVEITNAAPARAFFSIQPDPAATNGFFYATNSETTLFLITNIYTGTNILLTNFYPITVTNRK